MRQQAHWDEIREDRDEIADVLQSRHRYDAAVYRVGNGVVVTFEDGSQVTWSPAISKMAEGVTP